MHLQMYTIFLGDAILSLFCMGFSFTLSYFYVIYIICIIYVISFTFVCVCLIVARRYSVSL